MNDRWREVVVTPRRAFVALPDMTVIDRDDWCQITTPSFRQGGFNEISLARNVDDHAIARAIAGYRDAGIVFRWTVGPDSDADLAARLEAAGLAPATSLGMACATDATLADVPPIEIVRVDAATLEIYTTLMAEGWRVDRAPVAVANTIALADPRHAMYLAIVDGEPAGVAACVWFDASAYLLGAIVREQFRRRGIYRALVAARLADARARGIVLATSHARVDTSAPQLARLGFHEVCRFTVLR